MSLPASHKPLTTVDVTGGRYPRATGRAALFHHILYWIIAPAWLLFCNLTIPIGWLCTTWPLRVMLPVDGLYYCRLLCNRILGHFYTFAHDWVLSTELHITLEGIPPEEFFDCPHAPDTGAIRMPRRVIWIGNHQLSIDYTYLWALAHSARVTDTICALMRYNHLRTAVVGCIIRHVWVMQPRIFRFIGVMPVQQHWQEDSANLSRRLREVSADQERERALTFFVYPEGDLLLKHHREAMHQHIINKQLKIEPPCYTLLPRTTGLHFVLEQLYNPDQNAYAVSHLYDVTMALDGLAPDDEPCRVYSYFNMFCHGVRPRRVHLRIRRWHIADELPPVVAGRAALGDWLAARWQEKDQMLARFHATGSLAASNGADRTYVRRVRCRWTPSELWPYAVVIVIYAAVGTLTWQLQHFL